jgi:hypothetical protein
VERLQGERRVADPRIAVVPVALAAGGLRQRRCERRDGRAGWQIGEALDGQGRALDRVSQPVIRDPGGAEPAAPELDRGGHSRLRLLVIGGCRELLGPGEGAVSLFSRLEDVASAYALPLDVQREVGRQAESLPGPGRVGGMAVSVVHRPLRGLAAVPEGRLADDLDLDVALEALDRPHQHVVCVIVGGRPRVRGDLVLVIPWPDGQRVTDLNPPGRRLPGRQEDVRARLIRTRRRMVEPKRREAEEACLAVEEAAEDAR